MATKEEQEFIIQLLDKVDNGEHYKFTFIRNIEQLRTTALNALVAKKATKAFKKEAKLHYKNYLSGLYINQEIIQELVTYRLFIKCADFYKEEKYRYFESILEYAAYLTEGHLRDALTGENRLKEDLIDYSYRGYKEEKDPEL